MFQHRGERLLQPAGKLLLVRGEVVPRRHAGIARSHRGTSWDDAHLQLTPEPAFAQNVVTLVEATAPSLQVVVGSLMRRMHRAEREVQEERTVGTHRHEVANPTATLIDEVFTDVVAGTRGRIDVMVVVSELGVELIGLALQETVKPIEAFLERPVVMRSGGGRFFHRREVPLTGRVRRIAVCAQQLCDRRRTRRDATAHMRIAGVPIRDPAHTDGVVVASGEQACASRRAQRSGVETGITQSAGREPIDVRCCQRAAVAVEVCEAGVVEHDHHHVGSAQSGRRRGPRRLRFVVSATDSTLEVRFAQHQFTTGAG